MYIAELVFKIANGRPGIEKYSSIRCVMGALWENGQILDPNPPIVATTRRYTAVASLPEPTSLEAKLNGAAVKERLAALAKEGLGLPEVKLRGRDPGQLEPCACRKPRTYILSTAWFDDRWTSPLQCGDCFLPVPLYRVPPTHEYEGQDRKVGHWDLLEWERYHRACEGMWIYTGALLGKADARTPEFYAVRQIERIDSGLIRCGRKLCATIEESTRRPTYYALTRMGDARSVRKEWLRPCPACGGQWRLDEPWHRRFYFRCDACRLLSEIAGNAHGRPKGV